MTGIYELGDGCWEARVQIQDGIERKLCATKQQAIEKVVSGEKHLNNTDVDRSEVAVYRRREVVKIEYYHE